MKHIKYAWNKFFIGQKRRALLQQHRWYQNMAGGWTHPHQLDYMSHREICRLTPEQLAYKLAHGSQARLPE